MKAGGGREACVERLKKFVTLAHAPEWWSKEQQKAALVVTLADAVVSESSRKEEEEVEEEDFPRTMTLIIGQVRSRSARLVSCLPLGCICAISETKEKKFW